MLQTRKISILSKQSILSVIFNISMQNNTTGQILRIINKVILLKIDKNPKLNQIKQK